MKKLTSITFSFCLCLLTGALIISSCKSTKPTGGNQGKAPINFCGEFDHGDQPASFCDCTADSTLNEQGQFVKTPKYRWFDRFGNRYCNLYISDPCAGTGVRSRGIVPGVNYGPPDKQSAGGLFNLYIADIQKGLTTGFGAPGKAAFINVITQVFSDLDAMLVTPASSCGAPFVPVNIEIQSVDKPNSTILGQATAYYDYMGETSGIKHNEIWKGINGGANDPNLWDGYITINLGYTNFYTGYNGQSIPSGKLDLYTLLLHEVLHAMGFGSLIAQNGSSQHQLTSGTPALYNYSVFDQFLKFENGPAAINNTGVITNSGGYNWSYNINSNPNSDLISGCQNPSPAGPDIRFSGTNNTSGSLVYAPDPWSNESSLSHFNIGCDNSSTSNFVMHNELSYGIYRRITTEEVQTLCDLGYAITGTYGAPTLDVGGNNPNVKTIPACGQLLAAVDDNGPCCQNSSFIVQLCPGNTLLVGPNELTCNDVYSGSVNVVDFEVISSGTALAWNGSNFVYTPTQLGTEILRYRLQDGNGNFSNYAYVYIDVWSCSTISACTNTSLCNLICNPSFIDNNSNCTSSCNNEFKGLQKGGASCLEGWVEMFRSPDFISSPPCPNSNTNGVNQAQLPGNTGGKVQISGNSNFDAPTGVGHPQAGIYNEAIMAEVNISQGRKYIVSLFAQEFYMSGAAAASLRLGLINDNVITWNTTGNSKPLTSVNHQAITIIDAVNIQDNFNQYVFCFTASGNYDRFFIQGGRTDGLVGAVRTLVDQVDLIEDLFDGFNTAYTINCGQSIIIGKALCSVTNMNYSWWDVTNAFNPVQLTNGATILGSNISIPTSNINGSQLQVAPISSKVYELRRRMVSSNSLPIGANNCDAAVQVSVTVNADITIEKSILSGPTAPAGGTVQFQLSIKNKTGVNLANFVIEDALSNNLLASTLSVNSNANVTHVLSGQNLDFTILSLPDGGTEAITYSIQVSTAPNQNVITNCATADYGGCIIKDCVDITLSGCVCPGWPQSIPNGSSLPTPEIQVASNGDVFVAGAMLSPTTFTNCGNTFNINGDGFLAKYNSCGRLLWVESLPKAGVDLALFESGGLTYVYVTGNTSTNSPAPHTAFIAKFEDNGATAALSWSYDISGDDTFSSAIGLDNQGNAYIIGNLYDNVNFNHFGGVSATTNVSNNYGIFIAKYGPGGSLLYQNNIQIASLPVLTCPNLLSGKGISVSPSGDKVYILADGQNATLDFGLGSTVSLSLIPVSTAPICVGADIVMALFEGSGNAYNCTWAEKITGNDFNAASDIQVNTSNNDFYIIGWASDNSSSATGFDLPPLSGIPAQDRGHFLAKYTNSAPPPPSLRRLFGMTLPLNLFTPNILKI